MKPGYPVYAHVPVDLTSAQRQARMRARLGSPVKAYLQPDLRTRLERCAARRQVTLAAVLRLAIDQFLDAAEDSTPTPVCDSPAPP